MRTGLAPEFSRANFESASDLQGLCARLARVLTARVRAATDLHMEIEWIVADLRNVGHDVQWWDAVIANWDGQKQDPYLWVTLQGVDTLDLSSNGPDNIAAAEVTVSFRPRLPRQGDFKCPLCWSGMEEREIWLSVQGHGSFVAPGVRVHFECPGVPDLDATVGTASAERRRPVRVCSNCGAGLLLPLPR